MHVCPYRGEVTRPVRLCKGLKTVTHGSTPMCPCAPVCARLRGLRSCLRLAILYGGEQVGSPFVGVAQIGAHTVEAREPFFQVGG